MGVQKNVTLTKIEPDTLDDMLKKYQEGSRHLLETIKFVYSLKENKDFKKIVSMNSGAVDINVTKLMWVFLKYYKIARELISIRRKIVHGLFDKYYSDLNQDKIDELIKNTGNVWLEAQPQKINVLKDYCTVLLSDTYFRKDICTQGISIGEYEKIQENFRQAIQAEIILYFNIDKEFDKNKKFSLYKRDRTDAYVSMELYQKTYDEDTLLEKE